MAALVADLDLGDFKALRCAQRKKSLGKKRADFDRKAEYHRSADPDSKGRARSVPMSYRRSHPHSAARTAARTLMAKGQVGSGIDVPCISMGWVGERKPFVSPLLNYFSAAAADFIDKQHGFVSPMLQQVLQFEKVPCKIVEKWDECDLDAHTTASEGLEFEWSSDCDTTSPVSTFAEDAPLDAKLANDLLDLEAAALGDATMDESPEEILSGAPKLFDEDEDEEPQGHTCVEAAPEEQESIQHGCVREGSHREQVMRQVIGKLREQALVAEWVAEAEKARAQELEKQVSSPSQKQAEKNLAKKDMLQAERQRCAQLRKQCNQAAHLQAIKEKAELALHAAAEIRCKAEVEVAETHARLLAEASMAAQERVDAQVQEVLVAAKAEVDAWIFDTEEATKQAQDLKAEAEVQLVQMKAHAEKEHLAAQAAKAEAKALRSEAEKAARAIREAALEEAKAFKARVEVQIQEKFDASVRAQQELEQELADAKAAAAAEAERSTESKASKKVTAALKLAKAMEQQRSKKFQKQAVQERQQEQIKQREFHAVRTRIEEGARAAHKQAMADIASMKTKAEADAKLARQRAMATAKVEAEAEAKAKELGKALAAQAKAQEEEMKMQAHIFWKLEDARLLETVAPALSGEDQPVQEEDVEAALPEVEEDWHVLLAPSAEVVDSEWDVISW